jgi:hypothetical protein
LGEPDQQGTERSPISLGGGAAPTKLIIGISTAGTAATLMSSELGIPRWVTISLFGAYALLVAGLVALALFSTTNPPRQWLAYRLLRVVTRWLPELAEAVKPEQDAGTTGAA